jgi:rsbT co-antagonist protein RsbR
MSKFKSNTGHKQKSTSLDAKKILDTMDLAKFGKNDEELLKTFFKKVDKNLAGMIDDFYKRLFVFDYPKAFFTNETLLTRVKSKQVEYFKQFFIDNHDVTFFQTRQHLGSVHERIGLDNYWYLTAYAMFYEMLVEYASKETNGYDVMKSLGKLMLMDIAAVMTSYLDAREEVISAQSSEVLELSSPVLKITEDVTVIPLIGTLDSARAFAITEKILKNIEDSSTRVVILDITGVPVIDTATGANLVRTVKAIQLMGSECIITGIKPSIAQTIVELGIELSTLKTKNTLAGGLKEALSFVSGE